MKILSYNLWFDSYKKIERLDSLLDVIQKLDPDVLCFQEVTLIVFEIMKHKLKNYKYWYPDSGTNRYICIIASKNRFLNVYTLEYTNITNMGRNLSIVVLEFNEKKVAIGNTHFESEFKKDNKNKKKQFEHARRFLENLKIDRIVLCCDSNICNKQEELLFFANWKDCWKLIGDENNRFTYDYKTNCYIKNIKFRSRLDRVVIKWDIEPIQFKIIKNTNKITPSDHHGVYVCFKL